MGHPSSDERKQFINLSIDCGNNRTWHVCRHCDEAYKASEQGSASLEPKRIKGRIENFQRHLKRCQCYLDYLRDSCARSEIPAPPSKTQTTIYDFFVGTAQNDARKDFERALLEFQADNNLPESFIERPSTFRLLDLAHKMNIDVAPLPKRKSLGGHILDGYAVACDGQDTSNLRQCQAKTGARVSFCSDGWQNIAKEHLLDCKLSLYGNELTYGLFETASRHDGIAIAEQMEGTMINMQKDGWQIGAVVTDNAGQCGRARRILSLRWPEMAFVICFAHDLNNLVKAVLKSNYSEVTKQASDAVNTIIASSGKWLVEAHICMTDTYGYKLNFKQLCETRWNSMHGCFASLLRVRKALELLELKFRNDDDLPNNLKVFAKPTFWAALRDAEEVVRPLSYASLKLQRNENTMADVVVCYLDIFEGFSKHSFGSMSLIDEVEKRWRQCEQPLMLLALFLHPAHRQASKKLLNKSPLTTIGSLCRIGLYYFKRYNINHDATGLYEDLAWWIDGDDGGMLPFADFRTVDSYWVSMRADMPGSRLPQLALTVLAFAVNTATCERYFSELALIHTAKRNRMSPEKARKLALVRKRVREYDQTHNPVKAKKRKRLIDPAERTLLRDRDDRFESAEPEEENQEADIVEGPDTALEYWSAVLCELEPDSDPQKPTDTPPDTSVTTSPDTAAADEANKARLFALKVQEIKAQSAKPTPTPDRRPFPNYNDMRFPQEKSLPGLRGQKASLAELSGASGAQSAEPGEEIALLDVSVKSVKQLEHWKDQRDHHERYEQHQQRGSRLHLRVLGVLGRLTKGQWLGIRGPGGLVRVPTRRTRCPR